MSDTAKNEAEAKQPIDDSGYFGSEKAIEIVEAQIVPSVSWREILAILAIVVLCDLTVFRGQGYAGFALLLIVAPFALIVGSPFRLRGATTLLIAVLLTLLAGKCLWYGWSLNIAVGVFLLVALAMSLAGLRPYVVETIVFASHTVMAGYFGLRRYQKSTSQFSIPITGSHWFSILLPLVAFLVFGGIFLLANPDLLSAFGDNVRQLVEHLRQDVLKYAPTFGEVVFWIVVLWVTVGLLRPVMLRDLFKASEPSAFGDQKQEPCVLYPAVRNMLVTVIALFAVYLVFEFKTLWFRVFPERFHYSGYAHQGAAWLTVALAVATGILSLVFRGAMLRDKRVSWLRTLAWLWSIENFVLALAVYHRLMIYVGYNGMTRMRIVGFFGITAVVIGFGLVLWKIARGRDFIWLMRRHLCTVAIVVYLFSLTPLDAVVVSYNARRIMRGDPAPCVQVNVHPISPEGTSLLLPLLECEDQQIRSGVRALLARRHEEAERAANEERHWTAFQFCEQRELRLLQEHQQAWAEYKDATVRRNALAKFYDYGYRWY